jgi:hypothetical protein
MIWEEQWKKQVEKKGEKLEWLTQQVPSRKRLIYDESV